jgi:hypothetical protein
MRSLIFIFFSLIKLLLWSTFFRIRQKQKNTPTHYQTPGYREANYSAAILGRSGAFQKYKTLRLVANEILDSGLF